MCYGNDMKTLRKGQIVYLKARVLGSVREPWGGPQCVAVEVVGPDDKVDSTHRFVPESLCYTLDRVVEAVTQLIARRRT